MSRASASETFNLTLMINKERTKVLFAFVDSDFADVLLSFLALPLGVILKLLADHCGEQAPKIGSLKLFTMAYKILIVSTSVRKQASRCCSILEVRLKINSAS